MVDTVNKGLGSGVFDHALMFISTGNVTRGYTNTSALKIRGTPHKGLSVRMMFPSTPGTTCRVLPQLYASTNNSTYRLVASYKGGYQSWASGGREIQWDFDAEPGMPYVRLTFTFANGTTGSSYGAVKAGIVPKGEGEWNRAVRWN